MFLFCRRTLCFWSAGIHGTRGLPSFRETKKLRNDPNITLIEEHHLPNKSYIAVSIDLQSRNSPPTSLQCAAPLS